MLWQDSDFPGSYSGIYSFANNLRYYLNKHITNSKIRKVLHQIPGFYAFILRPKRGQRRQMNLNNFCQLVQVDLAFMNEYDEFNCFLTFVDVFSQHIWARPLKSKKSSDGIQMHCIHISNCIIKLQL